MPTRVQRKYAVDVVIGLVTVVVVLSASYALAVLMGVLKHG